MRNPGGYGVIVDPVAGKKEVDSFTCGHCNVVVWVKPMRPPEESGGLCKVCMKLTCPICTAKMTCTPLEKAIEAEEAKNRFVRSCGLLEQGKLS